MHFLSLRNHKKSIVTLFFSVIILTLYFFPSITHGAINLDSTSSASTGSTNTNTLSWFHTVSGTDRILIVGISLNANTRVSSINYGSTPLTKITAYESGNAVRVSLWYVLNPPLGTQKITVALPSSTRFVAGAHTYTGVNQQIPFGSPVVARGFGTATTFAGTTASITVPSGGDEIVVDVLARRGDLTTNPILADSQQTTRWNTRTMLNSNTNGITGGGSSKPGSATTKMTWTWPSTRAWAIAGISLKPSPGHGDQTPPLRFNGVPSGELPLSTTQTTISLQTNENATCQYSTEPGLTYLQMTNTFGSTGSTSHSEFINGIIDGASYSYYVRCSDTQDNRNGDDFLISFSVATPPPPPPDTEPPSVPQNLLATAVTYSHIDLSWEASYDNVSVSGYKIFQNDLLVATTVNNSYQATNLDELTSYKYQIMAFDDSGNESTLSQSSWATTPEIPIESDTESPSTPQNLQIQTVSSSEISLTWDASTDNISVIGYNIFRNNTHIASVLDVSYTDNGLDSSTMYQYAVSSFDASNNESSRSNTASATTFSLPQVPDTLPPTRFNGLPSGTLPSETENEILILETDEISQCRYSTSANNEFDSMENAFFISNATVHENSITGLLHGNNYEFFVRCKDDFGNVNNDDFIIQFFIEPASDLVSPSIPQNPTVLSVSPSHISFSWTPSTDNVGVSGYKIFRNDLLIGTTLDSEYSDFGLSELTQYTYTISAFDASQNESENSEALFVTTLQQDTIAPIISNITTENITEQSALISWQTDKPSTSRVEYGFTTLYGAEVMSNELTTTHQMLLNGLSALATYNFRVRSIDGSGNDTVSENYVFNTLFGVDTVLPLEILDLRATEIGHTFINLAWTASGDNEDTGQAFSYDIRFSKNKITLENWDSATVFTGVPTPMIAKTPQNYIVAGLKPSSSYYFAIRSIDSAGNISLLSNILSVTTLSALEPSGNGGSGGGYVVETTPPATPSDFRTQPSKNEIVLLWNNPLDDDFVRVIIVKKIGSAPLSREDGVTVYEGLAQEFIDTNVIDGLIYFYAIFSYDRALNYSPMAVMSTQLQGGDATNPVTIKKIELEAYSDSDNIPFVEDFQPNTDVSVWPDFKFRFSRSLFFGIQGTDVGELQKILARNKIVYPRGIITQFFGNFTRDAVKKFQCAYGIICFGNEQSTGYGRVGPKTKAQLNKLITDNSSFVPRNEYISKNLSQGMRGEEVMKLQTFLVSIQLLSQEDITQNFDIKTTIAVQKFQCANNIICSQKTNVSGHGIVGPKTRAKINEIHSLK